MTLKGFMARGEREYDSTPDEAPKPVMVGAPAPRTVAPSTSIDTSTTLEGSLRCKQTLRIDGCIRGEVECEKTVLVSEVAKVYASIEADEVQIAGLVEGNITARRKITLQRTAVVTGDLITPGIVIEEGARLKGRIVIGSDTPGVDVAVDSESSREAKKAQAMKKQPAAASPKPIEAPAQPLAAASA